MRKKIHVFIDNAYLLVFLGYMEKSKQTRNYIIETAAPIFNKNGYAGTSLSGILEQTTLTKGAIYHHFENKDDLALDALEYNLKFLTDYYFSAMDDKTNSYDKLIVFAESYRSKYDSIKQIGGCPVLNASIDSDDGNKRIKTRINRFIKMWEKTIFDITEEGKLKKEIKPDVDSEIFAMNLISLVEGSAAMSKVTNNRRFVDSAVDLVKSLIESVKF